MFQWDDPTVGLHAESRQIAVTPESHRRVTTGSYHVVMLLVPLHCESRLTGISGLRKFNDVEFRITSHAAARLAHEFLNLSR